ncbi:T9SS type B sorting domain-containing protein [Epilithonimonas xixisoli]|uniref:Gliding motility-associated-like protein n=1 Tax=Epilithonimonas xixisoli TaxID=1476462 RepID=A0A4R8I908_9FLAO|nr:T9SS type B sorting domain-containing protein [Epilithonimonas xixisoli]TDX85970.1 gliding motility-associated-like protein [Epilithonimonas xixisoli]
MKKILLFLLLSIFSNNIFAQLDTEHWFAPMFDGQSNSSPYQYLYLSTDETTPFTVNVYNNNTVVYKATISKGSPQSINVTNRNYIITKNEADLHQVGTKGFYLKGDYPFFASLRFGMQNHAEIITSKGDDGLGMEFYTATVPNSLKNGSGFSDLPTLGFGASFLATQDNTKVTVGNFKKPLSFTGFGTATSFTFTLNKGQSYIIDGRSDSEDNQDGFIGATVTADKPISMSNGSFNGQFSTIATSGSGSDIYMDQSVPVNKLGDEFVIVKGYGYLGTPLMNNGNKMEGAIIIATKNNTQIYLNDSTTPIATLASAGDYYSVSETNYIDRGNSHYNLHIKTTENVYVYQMMGGVESSSEGNPLATGGMNYIPPLNCYLPRKIEEIGSINMIGNQSFTTKLNIITEKGANVTVNGVVPNPQYGPYDTSGISANQKWVTYSIPNQTGNITVVSDKAVTAGLSGGNMSAGYGGYFAGFSVIPAIPQMEGCLPGGVVLKLSEGFNSYKWMFRDKDGNVSVVKDVAGSVPGANIINPTEIGYYWAVVQQGSCDPVTTPEMKVLVCFGHTAVTYNICDQLPPTPVKFSLGNQGIKSIEPVTDPANSTNPSKGQLVIDNAAKTISYIPNPGATGTDSFWYKITGDDPTTPDTEEVRVTINLKNIIANDTIIKGCKIDNVKGVFDLSKVNIEATLTKVFYKDPTNADADTGVNTIPVADLPNYQSAEGFVYLRLDNGTCKKTVKIELKFYPKAETLKTIYEGCNLDFKGVKINDFDLVKADLLRDHAFFTNVDFYLGSLKLSNGWTYSTDTVVRMEVISPDGCATENFNITFKVGAKLPLITNNASDKFCDPELNDSHTIDLNNFKHLFLNPADISIQPKFYNSLLEAQEDRNALGSGNVDLVGLGSKTFYYRFEDGVSCPNVSTLTLNYDKGFASTELPASPKIICEGSTISIDAGDKHTAFEWFDESDLTKVFPKTRKQILGAGKYHVILTSPNGCEYKQNFEILESPKAQLDVAKFNATICDDNLDGKVEVKFSTDVTPLILLNPHADLKVEYYLGSTLLSDNFFYSNTTRVNVKVVSKYCADVTGFIDFKIGNQVTLLADKASDEVCDDDLDGKFTVKNLDQYKSLFTNDASATVKFFVAKADAQNPLATNNVNEFEVTNQKLFYVRISNATDCPTLAELTIKIKLPKKSDSLTDKTICPDATTDLDADPSGALGSDFTYEWFNEENPTSSIGQGHYIDDLKVGKYFVIITAPNACPYKQNVEIKAAELPTIEGIEINGSTVKITAKGGKSPYQYAISTNGIISNYQESSTFTNVLPGLHKVYVISADNCKPVEKEFSVIEIYNLLTPNGDGQNDVLDMSLLKYKVNVKFQIVDRMGKKLFEGNTNNNYIWDGKEGGKTLPTSSYWYIMEWQDFENSPPVKYSGWILLKNRNSN